jgi:hypothetical protein
MGSFLKPLLKMVTLVVDSRMLCMQVVCAHQKNQNKIRLLRFYVQHYIPWVSLYDYLGLNVQLTQFL